MSERVTGTFSVVEPRKLLEGLREGLLEPLGLLFRARIPEGLRDWFRMLLLSKICENLRACSFSFGLQVFKIRCGINDDIRTSKMKEFVVVLQ